MWETTHHGMVRTYSITYVFADDPAWENHEILSTPKEMAAFGQTITGVGSYPQRIFRLAVD